MKKVCDYLEIAFDPEIVLNPTKVGRAWSGNSAAQTDFSQISTEPVSRWESELSEDEIGWVEWHCRDLMPEFGYEPRLKRRALRHWMKPIRGERPREYLKSRAYSLRDDCSCSTLKALSARHGRRTVEDRQSASRPFPSACNRPGEHTIIGPVMSGIFFDDPDVRF